MKIKKLVLQKGSDCGFYALSNAEEILIKNEVSNKNSIMFLNKKRIKANVKRYKQLFNSRINSSKEDYKKKKLFFGSDSVNVDLVFKNNLQSKSSFEYEFFDISNLEKFINGSSDMVDATLKEFENKKEFEKILSENEIVLYPYVPGGFSDKEGFHWGILKTEKIEGNRDVYLIQTAKIKCNPNVEKVTIDKLLKMNDKIDNFDWSFYYNRKKRDFNTMLIACFLSIITIFLLINSVDNTIDKFFLLIFSFLWFWNISLFKQSSYIRTMFAMNKKLNCSINGFEKTEVLEELKDNKGKVIVLNKKSVTTIHNKYSYCESE